MEGRKFEVDLKDLDKIKDKIDSKDIIKVVSEMSNVALKYKLNPDWDLDEIENFSRKKKRILQAIIDGLVGDDFTRKQVQVALDYTRPQMIYQEFTDLINDGIIIKADHQVAKRGLDGSPLIKPLGPQKSEFKPKGIVDYDLTDDEIEQAYRNKNISDEPEIPHNLKQDLHFTNFTKDEEDALIKALTLREKIMNINSDLRQFPKVIKVVAQQSHKGKKIDNALISSLNDKHGTDYNQVLNLYRLKEKYSQELEQLETIYPKIQRKNSDLQEVKKTQKHLLYINKKI